MFKLHADSGAFGLDGFDAPLARLNSIPVKPGILRWGCLDTLNYAAGMLLIVSYILKITPV